MICACISISRCTDNQSSIYQIVFIIQAFHVQYASMGSLNTTTPFNINSKDFCTPKGKYIHETDKKRISR